MIYAKKSLGQHFLKDEHIARAIVERFSAECMADAILEVGPGKGVLTKYLLQLRHLSYSGVELDERMIELLLREFPQLKGHLFHTDILDFDFDRTGASSLGIIGNFPYNISSQILFRIFDNRNKIVSMAGMFQKEVAKRIAATPGSREFGILSVFIQAFYEVSYWFDVDADKFIPPPKVMSGVIGLTRKKEMPFIESEEHFRLLVKAGFGQRRKKLRNSLHQYIQNLSLGSDAIFDRRAEQLSVEDWIALSNRIITLSKQ